MKNTLLPLPHLLLPPEPSTGRTLQGKKRRMHLCDFELPGHRFAFWLSSSKRLVFEEEKHPKVKGVHCLRASLMWNDPTTCQSQLPGECRKPRIPTLSPAPHLLSNPMAEATFCMGLERTGWGLVRGKRCTKKTFDNNS